MKVSFNQTTSPKVRSDNGYGYAGKMIQDTLRSLGHEVGWRQADADLEINFIQPEKWYWTGPYRIGYVPWESTKFQDGWIDKFNSVDEMWTPSPVVAQWMVDEGVKVPVHVYEHGVDPIWATGASKRSSNGTFKVIHHGAEAIRKGGLETMRAYMDTIAGPGAELTMKTGPTYPNYIYDTVYNINWNNKRLDLEDLVRLYHEHDLMVYPSYGEGFGFTPLQAMAGGMPVLISQGWAPYEDMLPEECLISTSLQEAPEAWQMHHPGKMFFPDWAEAREKLTWQFENREKMAEFAWNLSPKVLDRYNWQTLTRDAFARFV